MSLGERIAGTTKNANLRRHQRIAKIDDVHG